MSFFRRRLGITPTPETDGRGVIPSPLGLYLGVDKKSGYRPVDFGRKHAGGTKVLVLCTEERYLEMTNGVLFSTGHNVQETAVPLLHLEAAGFDFDVVTPTGAPAILEDWSVPRQDEAVLGFMARHRAKFDEPESLADLLARGALDDDSPYAALFLPGGHGAMVGLPDDANVGTLIRWVHDSDRYLVAVCHGPAALMATTGNGDGPHPYAGFELCAFPDSIDRQSPMIGYQPGTMPWFQCEALQGDRKSHRPARSIAGAGGGASEALGAAQLRHPRVRGGNFGGLVVDYPVVASARGAAEVNET